MPRWENQSIAFAGEPGKHGGPKPSNFIKELHKRFKGHLQPNMKTNPAFSPFTGICIGLLPKWFKMV
jgi:hypothetical protein